MDVGINVHKYVMSARKPLLYLFARPMQVCGHKSPIFKYMTSWTYMYPTYSVTILLLVATHQIGFDLSTPTEEEFGDTGVAVFREGKVTSQSSFSLSSASSRYLFTKASSLTRWAQPNTHAHSNSSHTWAWPVPIAVLLQNTTWAGP